ncbi:hypothetical protein NE237_012872 [Protea cynaroides]|uniref:Fungal lipase-type domain-containing protein n=1 Tax=Protea cynaroides TaxID=273540 RepID=A0A9Q0JXB3_9MAGN|nr:hypothetical protein NE237_012872 [Protea cynaroides]
MRDDFVRVPGGENSESNQPAKVECGLLSLYRTPSSNMPSLAESVFEEVRRLRELYKGETLSITVMGHSLGAALALLAAAELSTAAPDIAVLSFGGPRVGNRAFAELIMKKGVKTKNSNQKACAEDFANRSKSGGLGSKATGTSIASSKEVHNLSSSSEAESLDNDDVHWQQHGGGNDNQSHSESKGCQSDGEEDEVSDGGQSGGCMSGNEGDEDQVILKCVDSNKDIDDSNKDIEDEIGTPSLVC